MSDISVKICDVIKQSVNEAFSLEVEDQMVMVERPRDPKMGDYSTNIAMRLAKSLHKKPVDIANELIEVLKKNLTEASEVSVAGPGFINFKINESALSACINQIIDAGKDYGKSEFGKHEKLLVEYVSANPTGDLHCGHARGAAWGDALCRILSEAGFDVTREYYVNDAGNQIDMLAESMYSRYCELFGVEYPLPENGYHAQDIVEVAKKIKELDGDKWLNKDRSEWVEYFKDEGIEMKLDAIRKDLDLFRVHFDSWMHERFFYQDNAARINQCIESLKQKGLTYEKDGALWFQSTKFGDDKDRVLKKNTGLLTYLTPDIANHVYKFERGYDTLINLWGADHHSYVKRMKCSLEALGYNSDKMLVDLIQMVRMVSNGEEVKMSKRTGNAITIRELCEDVGVDAARWFFVSKELNTQMDFDMDLAKQKNNDNPVYYVQYAYTRMYNILHKEGTPAFEKKDSYTLLTDPKEIALLKQISEFPKKVEDAAKFRAVNRICQYCHDLAKAFHSYYNSCRVSDPANPELTNERLGLVNACMVTMANALDLIGVSAPEKM
ncbi:MAG: arginine--tRNA ligase [Erysipelotrichaceae bacterium]|jgi:arginyl-tRNA synthetase|nr:arginine--tRNA ligase [Erysipelotrichaceae bacterium]MDD7058520.1 arginine--tRNA ligase [Erysipelotrichaceae bacterium]MDY3660566.1 arginine--tRNA ligase [Bulleidia sp.]